MKVGRPKSDNPRTMTISEIRVTWEEYRMITLKSALYAGGSTAKLIRMATEAYQGEVRQHQPCSACGKTMAVIESVASFEFDTILGHRTIRVTGVPHYLCMCGEVEEDLLVLSALEQTLSSEVEQWQKKELPIPNELSFSSLLQSHPLQTPMIH